MVRVYAAKHKEQRPADAAAAAERNGGKWIEWRKWKESNECKFSKSKLNCFTQNALIALFFIVKNTIGSYILYVYIYIFILLH
jgi:hypothetical protein